ncbi:MAG: SCO family protein [Deltaproteobacteria bacterium]|nr:SCO family protein [Deltaproteobacteria bacterium]
MKSKPPAKFTLAATLILAVAMTLEAPALWAHNESPARVAADRQPEILKQIGFEQRLGAEMPGHIQFRNATGAAVRLSNYFSDKPVLLVFSYFDCPMLCPLVIDGMLRSLKPLSLQVGRDFDILVVSIDERDTPESAQQKKVEAVGRYGRGGDHSGWHFLTGEKAAIDALTQAAGFKFVYDDTTGQYAHASGIFVLTPSGRIARVFYGIDYAPRDLRLALVEASDGRIGSPIDQLLLYCYHYDPMTGKYGWAIMNSLRVAGSATVLALASFIGLMLRRDRRATRPGVEA